VVVVVPARFDERRIPRIVASRLDWIERTQARLGSTRHLLSGGQLDGSRCRPPADLTLAATGEVWRVDLVRGTGGTTAVRSRPAPGGGVLVISGSIDDERAVDALRRWLTRAARAHLEPALRQLGAAAGVTVGAVTIRSQRTLWASCAASGNISLNRCLLFLPPELVRYVLVHELCHRREMNHSSRFWRLVAAELPGVPELRAELRSAWRYVPSWALG
jgi:predicted metal-dependent hydrolase